MIATFILRFLYFKGSLPSTFTAPPPLPRPPAPAQLGAWAQKRVFSSHLGEVGRVGGNGESSSKKNNRDYLSNRQ